MKYLHWHLKNIKIKAYANFVDSKTIAFFGPSEQARGFLFSWVTHNLYTLLNILL